MVSFTCRGYIFLVVIYVSTTGIEACHGGNLQAVRRVIFKSLEKLMELEIHHTPEVAVVTYSAIITQPLENGVRRMFYECDTKGGEMTFFDILSMISEFNAMSR